jgi:hypothetical protein
MLQELGEETKKRDAYLKEIEQYRENDPDLYRAKRKSVETDS